jgi:hypothetical protein
MSEKNTLSFSEIVTNNNYYQVEPCEKDVFVKVKNEETGEETIKVEKNYQEYFKIISFPTSVKDVLPTIQLKTPTHLLAKVISVEEIETPESTQENPSAMYFIDAVNVIAFAFE